MDSVSVTRSNYVTSALAVDPTWKDTEQLMAYIHPYYKTTDNAN